LIEVWRLIHCELKHDLANERDIFFVDSVFLRKIIKNETVFLPLAKKANFVFFFFSLSSSSLLLLIVFLRNPTSISS